MTRQSPKQPVNKRAQWAQPHPGWCNKQLLLLLAQVIGAALDRIGTYNDLDNKQHVIALIDPEMCINCGEPPFLSSSFVLHFGQKRMFDTHRQKHEYLFYQHYWLIDRKMLHDVQRYGLPGDIFRRTNAPSQGWEWQWDDIYFVDEIVLFCCKRTSWGILIDMMLCIVKFSELLVPNVLNMQFSINWHLCWLYTFCAFWSMHTNEKFT